MVKVPPAKTESFISAPPNDLMGALIYGPDTGLVSLRAKKLAQWVVENPDDPFRSVDITTSALKDTPSLLSDEMAAITFGGGKRLIRLRDMGNSMTKPLESAFSMASHDSADHCFVLVTAGDLKPGTLRKLFENHKQLAAIACYVDDARSLATIIHNALRETGKQIDRDVVTLMADYCQGDRMIALSEIDKLLLYVGNDAPHITYDDARKCIGHSTESTLDDICNAVALGQRDKLQHYLTTSFQQGIMPIVIIRSLQRYFLRLQTVLSHAQNDMSIDEAMKQLRPPVFFKQAPSFKQALARWKQRQNTGLKEVNHLLYDAELACKRTGANAELLCSRSLLKIASLR